jgi:hypothetical protein
VDWQARIVARTGQPAVPVYNSSIRRTFWLPYRGRGVVAAVMDGRKFHIRELAVRTGYSVGGVHAALTALHKMGIGKFEKVRGRHGFCRFIFNRDCVARNVQTNESTNHSTNRSLDRERTLDRTFTPDGDAGASSGVWAASLWGRSASP